MDMAQSGAAAHGSNLAYNVSLFNKVVPRKKHGTTLLTALDVALSNCSQSSQIYH